MRPLNQRVAITGIGMVSPLGKSKETTWQALLNQQSGISEINNFDASHFPTKVAAEVKDFSLDSRVEARLAKYACSFVGFALNAAHEAFDDAKLSVSHYGSSRFGLVTGAGMMTAEFPRLKTFGESFAPEGDVDWTAVEQGASDYYSSADFGKTVANSGLALLASQFGIKGYCNAVHTACASGGQALGLAMQAIRRGEADAVLAGGFDSMINPVGVSSFCLLGALSTENTSDSSRPFDYGRKGFVLGEGACFLTLERYDLALKRGAHIYAELAGEGNSLSSYRITDSHPSGDGAIQAIEQALREGGVAPSQIDYINAHGTGTKMNDLSETNAIKAVFKEHAAKLAVSSTKSLTGHLIAGAGALEVGLSALAIKHQIAPMTANLKSADPECDLDYITEGPREMPIKRVLSHSFGFGGSNSAILLKSPDLIDERLQGESHE
jgi:3-oxoacyl-(acyl-carrier-protein) synthase